MSKNPNSNSLFELMISGETETLSFKKNNVVSAENESKLDALISKSLELLKNLTKDEINTAFSIHPASDYDGCRTFLTRACELGWIKLVIELINRGANIEIKEDIGSGSTPLIIAARSGNCELVKLLIEKGADPNHSDNHGNNALMALIQGNGVNLEAATSLIEAKINLNARDCLGKTALIYAAQSGNAILVELLIDSGADVTIRDNYFGSALIYFEKNGKAPELICRLQKLDRSYSIDYELLHECSNGIHSNEDLKNIEELINAGANINFIEPAGGITPLMLLSRYYYNVDGVKFLLKKKANPNLSDKKGKTAVSYAREGGSKEIIDLLIECGVKDDQGPLLLAAAEKDDVIAIAQILNAGANADYSVCDNITALHLAAKAGNYNAAALLLKHGAKPDHIDSFGLTPLIYLSSKLCQSHTEFTQNIKMINLLLDYGADPELKGKGGINALEMASCTKIKEIFAQNKSFFGKLKRAFNKIFNF